MFDRSKPRTWYMRSVTLYSPCRAVSWHCRQRLGLAVGRHASSRNFQPSMSQTTRPVLSPNDHWLECSDKPTIGVREICGVVHGDIARGDSVVDGCIAHGTEPMIR